MTHEDEIEANASGVAVRLTEWQKEPQLETLKSDLEMSKPAHDEHVLKVNRWLELRDGKNPNQGKTRKNRSKVQPKLVRRQAEWRYSALSEPFLSADDLFKVSPKTWEDKKAAEQNAIVLDHQFRTKINRVKFIDEYVRTNVDEGTVAVKVGWKRHTKMVKKVVPTYSFYPTIDPEYLEKLQQAVLLQQENPNEFLNLPPEMIEAVEYTLETRTPVIAMVSGEAEVEEEEVTMNQPTVDIINYENLFIDPSAEGDIKKAGFAVLSFETSKAELIKDGRYKNLDKVNYASNTPITDTDHSTKVDESQEYKDILRRRVVAYEYWGWHDIAGNDELVPIVATWIGDTLIRMEENPFPDKDIPIVIVPYMPIKRSVTGEPDAELLSENQAIQGALVRGMIDIMGRSANGQTGTAKGMLDVVNKRRYDSGENYEFNPNMQPSIGMHTHTYPEIPNSALTMLQLQNQDAEALSGVKAFSGGLSGEAYGEVAAGIKGMLDASSKREMAILRRMAQGMSEIGSKITSMNQAFLSEEETVRITNEKFVVVRRSEIQGNFDLEVDITTAEIDEAQAQDLAFMLQTMGNTLDFSLVQIILAEIAKLKRMPALAKKIMDYAPQPDPIEQRMRELQVEELEMKVAEMRSKAILNEAKARSEASGADLKDLDFMEQETGTKHEREIDKQKAQSEGNQALEITKALLNPPETGKVNKALQFGASAA